MIAASIPAKFPGIWAAFAPPQNVTSIPATTGAAGRASFAQGFPPVTFTQPAAGGTPPFGQDENGILQALSAWLLWAQAGGPVAYDAAFQTVIGGYPMGALVQGAVGEWWLSTTDNNITDPLTGGAGWVRYGPTSIPLYLATGTADALVIATTPATGVLTDGLVVGIIAASDNTGSITLDAGTGAHPVLSPLGAALQQGDVIAAQVILVIWNAAGTKWRLASMPPSEIAGAGLIPDGAGAVAVNITGLGTNIAPSLNDLVMVWSVNADELQSETTNTIAGQATQSDAFVSLLFFYGTMK